MWIDANPDRELRAGWIGHLLNDAAVCAGASDEEILHYYRTGARQCNCVMLPCGEAAPLMAVYTTCDVAHGEELLFSYGHDYWLSHTGKDVPPDSEAVAQVRRAWNEDLIGALAHMEEQYQPEIRVLEAVMGMTDQNTT